MYKKIILVTDTYHPEPSAGALLLRGLVDELSLMGHKVIIFCPENIGIDSNIPISPFPIILQTKKFKSKHKNKIKRLFAEVSMPLRMLILSIAKHELLKDADYLIWYSPSIFHTPFIKYLKLRYNLVSYLIIRDIFPHWAIQAKVINGRILSQILNFIARQQFKVADHIGVQSDQDIELLEKYYLANRCKIHLLENWMPNIVKVARKRDFSKFRAQHEFLFVYAGNMGVAQDIMALLSAIKLVSSQNISIGFLFIGRGDYVCEIADAIRSEGLDNLCLVDQLPYEEMLDIFGMCDAGIVSLDLRITSHNIPGKFISYIQHSLPVFARVRKDSDLANLIEMKNLGVTTDSSQPMKLADEILEFCHKISSNFYSQAEIRTFFEERYSPKFAASTIMQRLDTGR